MEYIVIIGIILGAGFYVVIPLLSSDQKERFFSAKTEDMLAQLNLKKENAYAAIKELEFDLSMKKLSEEDFDILKAQYMNDAVEYIKAIDKLNMQRKRQASLPEKDLENETKKEKLALHVGEISASNRIYCTQCGQGASSKDNFCVRCGTKLKKS